MKKNIKNPLFHILVCGVLCVNSCGSRSEDTPVINHTADNTVDPINAPDGTEIPVSIVSPIVSHQNISNEAPRRVKITDRNNNVELEIERELAIPYESQKLESGIHYRIVVYENNGKNYTFKESKDFISGDNSEITLTKSQEYKIIMYSLGTKEATPDLINRDNFNEVQMEADFSNNRAKDLLYKVIDFVPDGRKKLNINLKRKITSIQLVLDASNYYGNNDAGHIMELYDVNFVYSQHERVKLKISDNSIRNSGSNVITLNNSELDFNNGSSARESKWNNLTLNQRKDVSFSATINVNGRLIPLKVNIGSIKEGASQIVKVKIRKL